MMSTRVMKLPLQVLRDDHLNQLKVMDLHLYHQISEYIRKLFFEPLDASSLLTGMFKAFLDNIVNKRN